MKKLLLALSIVTFAAHSQAQTLNVNDIAAPGAIYYQGQDTMPASGITIGNAGASQTWDFSALVNHNESVFSFVTPASTPHSSYHSSANLCMLSITGTDTIYIYANNTASLLELEGQSLLNPITGSDWLHINQNPRELLLNFPTQLGTEFFNTSKYQIQVTGASVGQPDADSIRMRVVRHKHVLADATGDVITPSGSFTNCLRVYSSISDSTYIDVKVTIPFVGPMWQNGQQKSEKLSYTYDWWMPGYGFTVATLNYDSLNAAVLDGQYTSLTPLRVSAPSKGNKLSVYPVPAKNEIYFVADKAESIVISDVTGRIIVNGKLAMNDALNVTALPDGVYFANVKDANDVSIGVTRIVISK